MKRITLTALAALLLGGEATAQRGYEWDQADKLGVRYLLYQRMKPTELNPAQDGPHAVALYVPTDETEWVEFKGTTWNWGVSVYQFPKDPAALESVKGHPPAKDFEEFVLRSDPSSSHYRYFAVEGEERKGERGTYRHWEYFDAYPGIAGEERGYRSAGSRLYWAEDLELGLRHCIAEGMYLYRDRSRHAPSYRRHRYLVSEKHRIRVEGPPLPVAFALNVLHFPKGGSGAGPADFATVAALRSDGRELRVRGEERTERGTTFRWWHWFDDNRSGRPSGSSAVNYHVLAASYGLECGEVVLQMELPADGPKLPPELESLGRRVVSSLELMTEKELERSRKKPLPVRFVTYRVAGCHQVGDREVVMVVRHPVLDGIRPNRRQLERARRMVSSVEPVGR